MATTSSRLTELGMVPDQAKELLAQFTAGVGDYRRLAEVSFSVRLATELATQAAGTKSSRRLIECGMAPDLAREVVA